MWAKVKESFRILFSNIGLFAALVCTVWVPCNLLLNYHEYRLADPDDLWSGFKMAAGLQSVFDSLLAGGVVHAVVRIKLGERPSYGECMGAAWRFWGRMFGAWFIAGLYMLAGLICLVVPAIYLGARLTLVDAVVVIEESRPGKAVDRSGVLTKGRIGSILSIGILFLLIGFGASFVLYLPTSFVEELDDMYYSTVVDSMVDVLMTFASIAMVLYYLEARNQERDAEEARAARLEAARQRRLDREARAGEGESEGGAARAADATPCE